MAHYWGQINYFDAVLMQINCTKMAHSNVIQCHSILSEHFPVDYQFPIVLPRKMKIKSLIFGTHV